MNYKLLLATIFTTVCFCLFISQNAKAVKAYPFPIEVSQSDNSKITITLKGDEVVSWGETQDGFTLLNNGKDGWEYAILNAEGDLVRSGILAHNQEVRTLTENAFLLGITKKLKFSKKQIQFLKSFSEVRLRDVSSINAFDPNESKNLLLILIGFTDLNFRKTQLEFNNLMNQVGYNLNGATGSVKDFFKETSYDKFNLTTTVSGPYVAAHDSAYYGTNTPSKDFRIRELIAEAVDLADPNVNYADYDNDNDGSVDGVYVVYAGYGEATGGGVNCIWPHASSITTLIRDGKSISRYSCSNELNGNSGSEMTTIGVICHEFGHVCGSPDFYDTDYETGGDYEGTGRWDIMSGGNYCGNPTGSTPPHFNPYIKALFGWSTPELLTSGGSITVPDITTNNKIYQYNTKTPGEYFLLENRQQVGFNAGIPGHGLMIYHKNGVNYATNKNMTHPQGFYPVCASATTNPSSNPEDYGNINSSGCSFPGSSNNKGFYDKGMPSSKSWAGENTEMPITNISENVSAKTVSFTISSLQTCSSAPSTQSSSFNIISSTSNSINIGWIRGDGDNLLVVCREGSPVDLDPFNGSGYTANSNFKSGNEIGSGNYVVYNGTGTSVNVTGLYSGSQYYFALYEYNASGYCYLVTPILTGNASTDCETGTLPYFESFENKSFGCWSIVDNKGNGQIWKLGTYSLSTYTPALTGKYAYLPASSYGDSNSQNTDLVSPTFDLSEYKSVVLKFKHDYLSYTGTSASVYYSIDDGSTWTLLKNYTSWTATRSDAVSLSVNAAAGHSQVKFKWNFTSTDYGYYWAIDDIEVVDNGNYWTGAVSSEWNNSDNWSSSVPTSTSDVIIQSGKPNMPLISTASASCQDLIINSGATLTISSQELAVSGNWINNGSFVSGVGTGSVNFNGTNSLQTISGTTLSTFNILKVSKGSLSRVLESTSLIALTGTTNPLVIASGTFKLSSGSTITPFTSSPDLNNLCGLWNNGGVISATNVSCVYNNGLIRNTNGTLDLKAINYYGSSSRVLIEGGTMNITNYIGPNAGTSSMRYEQTGGIVNLAANSTATPFNQTYSGNVFTLSGGKIVIQKASSNVDFDIVNFSGTYNVTGGTLQIGSTGTPSSQTIRINSSVPLYDLDINSIGSPTLKLLSNLTVKNDILLGSTLNTNSFNISLGGDFINNGVFIPGTTSFTFNGTATQNISGSITTTFNNVSLNNSTGLTLNGSVNSTVNGELSLVSGVLDTDANTLVIGSGGSVARTLGHVFGKLQKNYSAGSNISRIFEVGGLLLADYSPVSVNFASVTTAGNLIVSSSTGDHASISNSEMNPFKSVNKYWSLTNNGIGFTSFDGVFSFGSVNLDGASNTDNLKVGNFSSSTWTYPTLGTKTSTSTQIIGSNSFGDFQLAEGYSKTSVVSGGVWSSASTWSPSGVPAQIDNIKISSPGTVIVDIYSAVCNDLVLPSGSKLEIQPNRSLSINGNLRNESGSTGLVVQSDISGFGSLITGSLTESVNANVQMYMTGNKWHMISGPVVQSISGFLANNPQISTKNVTSRGMMDYNTASNAWNSFFTNDKTGNIEIGKGYFMRTSADATLTYSGSINSGSQSVSLVKSGDNGWNVVGNPFTSAIKINNNAGINNFIATNGSLFDPSYVSIYIWDETYSSTQYKVINQSDGAFYGSIGQAFFVKTSENASILQFAPSMCMHREGNALRSNTNTTPEIKLIASISDKQISTSIRFIGGTTKGLDPGYDAGFLNLDASFGLYTRLIEDNGTNFAIQCLPDNDYKNVIIPIGVDCKSGGEIMFSASTSCLPSECLVILEDRLNKTLTDLSKDSYSTSIDENSSIIDRFRLHTSSQLSGWEDYAFTGKLNVFVNKESEIHINGSVSNKAVLKVYDVTGRIVLIRSLIEGGANVVTAKQLNNGIYLLKIIDNRRDESFKISIKNK